MYSDLPMQGAVATLEMGETATSVAVENGRFQARLDLPFQFGIMGHQELKLSIKPTEPWQLSTETKMRIFVINSPLIGIILAIVIPSGVVSIRRRRRLEGEGEISPIPSEMRRFAEDISLLHKPEAKLEGTRRTVLQAYFGVVKGVENVTQIPMKPQMTLREFSEEAMPELSGAAEAFDELTDLAERALYSSCAPEKDEALRAENLASQVRRRWLI